jgi:formylglycine-generating enzyme required for sulfatase activity
MKSRICTLSVLAAALACCAEPGMVFIPGGEFLRGRSHALPDDDLQWYPEVMKDDRPVKKIRVDAFYMDQYEVTNADYARFVIATKHRPPHHWPGGKVVPEKEKQPVANVSWEDAAAYAKWAGKRLPTEAEWERACRGMREGATYSWGEGKPSAKFARYGVVSGPQETGKCAANDFGLHDIAGNVWEWTADYYERDYYAASPPENPHGPENGRYRVLRGGSWADVAKYLTCAHRSWARPAERSPNIGFRCVKPLVKK